MTKPASLFDVLKARGEEFFNRVSQELMSNPNFVKAMQAAWWGKEKLDQAVAQALKTMNVPTRGEFDRALRRLAEVEQALAALKAARARPSRPRKTPKAAARARHPQTGSGGA